MPVYRLIKENIFPDPELAEDGLLAVGGDLRPERLLLAYANGIFPWPYGEEYEMTWYSPEMRLVLYPQNLHVSRRLQRTVQQQKFTVKMDTRFADVIHHCAHISRTHEAGTWITSDIQQAYINLHELGYAHSVETYFDDQLVGGMYGISLGKAFFGESMFHYMSDASKVALYYLVEKIKAMDFDFLDAQVRTEHMVRMGAEEIPRRHYLRQLELAMEHETHRGMWEI